MAVEPIALFARLVDPAGVARRLRELVPGVEIDGPDDRWRHAVVAFPVGKKRRSLILTHEPSYYAEPNWSSQMTGMRGYFSGFPDTRRKPRVIKLVSNLRFALGALFNPDYDPEGDPRLDVLFAVAEHLDGVLFTPTSLRDAHGRILFGAGGEDEEDPNAAWPRDIGEPSRSESRGGAVGRR
jgi:hypothetical protein